MKRSIDVLVSDWAAAPFRAGGFKKKHRLFSATGERGVHLRIEFRLHPLPVRCDTFWFEWTPSSQDDHRYLASRVPIPPAMCLDADYAAVFPPEYVMDSVDLWRVSADTVETYGPLLIDQIGRFMPYWQQILSGPTAQPPDTVWTCVKRLQPPRSELATEVAENVVAGHAEASAHQIRQLATQYPNNAWTLWWRGLLPS